MDVSLLQKSKKKLHIDELPDCALLTIFSFLSLREVCAKQRVCKRWHELLQDYSLWSAIVIDRDSHLASCLSEEILARWTRRWNRHVKHLRFRYCRKLTNFIGQLLSFNCTRLVSIDLQGCIGIGDFGVGLIAERCSMLKKVNFFMTGVTDAGFSDLIRRVPGISTIKLPSKGNCYRSLDSVCSYCLELDALVLNDVIPFDHSDPAVRDSIVCLVATSFRAIRKISLSWCWYITDQCLLTIAQNCKNLFHLGVRECHQITDHGVATVLQMCPNLEKLQLGRLYGVTDALAKAFIGRPNKLRRLKLIDTSITDMGISKILENTPEVVRVFVGEYCYNSSKITGDFVFSCLKFCKQIIELVIVSSTIVNDEMLMCITENLPKLKTLCLSSCSDVTRTGLESMLTRTRRLRVLRMCKCSDFDDSMLESFAERFMSLVALELYGCTSITYEGVRNFIRKKRNCSLRL